MSISNKSISSWVRQSRHRAKKQNIYSDLSIDDVTKIIEDAKCQCAYCDVEAETLDCPFPLKDDGPHVPSNIVPCCKKCKRKKNNNDIVWYYSNGYIEENTYLALIQKLLKRRGGDLIKEHMRRATGLGDKSE